jgi:hypothetical protein
LKSYGAGERKRLPGNVPRWRGGFVASKTI